MRNQNIDQGWQFNHGTYEGLYSAPKEKENRIVNLPHDYMIESDPTESAAAGPASGYYTAGVACYTKYIMIPEEWENEEIYLHFDGVMLNATVDINGGKAALQHNGYIPFSVNITPYIYFGKKEPRYGHRESQHAAKFPLVFRCWNLPERGIMPFSEGSYCQ